MYTIFQYTKKRLDFSKVPVCKEVCKVREEQIVRPKSFVILALSNGGSDVSLGQAAREEWFLSVIQVFVQSLRLLSRNRHLPSPSLRIG